MKYTIEGEHTKLTHSAYVRCLKVTSPDRTWYEVEWRSVGLYGYPPKHWDFETEGECQRAIEHIKAANGGLTEHQVYDLVCGRNAPDSAPTPEPR